MEQLQREFPDAHFVKAFNSVGTSAWSTRNFRRQAHHVHLRQQRSREETGDRISDQFGWETADMGARSGACH